MVQESGEVGSRIVGCSCVLFRMMWRWRQRLESSTHRHTILDSGICPCLCLLISYGPAVSVAKAFLEKHEQMSIYHNKASNSNQHVMLPKSNLAQQLAACTYWECMGDRQLTEERVMLRTLLHTKSHLIVDYDFMEAALWNFPFSNVSFLVYSSISCSWRRGELQCESNTIGRF